MKADIDRIQLGQNDKLDQFEGKTTDLDFLLVNLSVKTSAVQIRQHGVEGHAMTTEGHITKPLLVLLDVRMPGMDGRECALQIQELAKQSLGG